MIFLNTEVSMSTQQVENMSPVKKLATAAVAPGAIPLLAGAQLMGDKKKLKAQQGILNDPEGYAAGEVDRYAAGGDVLASGGLPGMPKRRRASAGTVEADVSVQPRIDQLTNLFASRKSYIDQKRLAPGLR